jgi:hypothetical protein
MLAPSRLPLQRQVPTIVSSTGAIQRVFRARQGLVWPLLLIYADTNLAKSEIIARSLCTRDSSELSRPERYRHQFPGRGGQLVVPH